MGLGILVRNWENTTPMERCQEFHAYTISKTLLLYRLFHLNASFFPPGNMRAADDLKNDDRETLCEGGMLTAKEEEDLTQSFLRSCYERKLRHN